MIGLRVICIKLESLNNRLEIGKIYTVRDVSWSQARTNNFPRKYYVVVSDKGEKTGWISANYFKPLSEMRQEKLNELGI
jgi:hypothetical protein